MCRFPETFSSVLSFTHPLIDSIHHTIHFFHMCSSSSGIVVSQTFPASFFLPSSPSLLASDQTGRESRLRSQFSPCGQSRGSPAPASRTPSAGTHRSPRASDPCVDRESTPGAAESSLQGSMVELPHTIIIIITITTNISQVRRDGIRRCRGVSGSSLCPGHGCDPSPPGRDEGFHRTL